jgi:SAM-dependent MidA family methyltransferase
MNISLPTPNSEALGHSAALVSYIQNQIKSAGGWIDFSTFMQCALYAPGLGYYSSGAKKFGATGDFVTAPEISPLFGRALAKQVQQVLCAVSNQINHADILELGAGTGRLAQDLLMELTRLNQLPNYYYILEVSADLRDTQRKNLYSELPEEISSRVVWLDRMPESFEGLVIANEVLDALPVHIIEQAASSINEVGVSWEDGHFAWKSKQLESETLLDFATKLALSEGYVTEICPAATGLLTALAGSLQLGAVIMIDYGFSRAEYYHPQRRQGTLMCHYRHHSHSDPFLYLGLQDITAHVDFTRIAQAGVEAGLSFVGYLNQAQFLINCEIIQSLECMSKEDIVEYLSYTTAVQKLLSPAEMGELFKVIAFDKNIDIDFIGFSQGDKSHTL